MVSTTPSAHHQRANAILYKYSTISAYFSSHLNVPRKNPTSDLIYVLTYISLGFRGITTIKS